MPRHGLAGYFTILNRKDNLTMEELKVKFLMGPPDCNDPHIPEYSENYLKELGKVLGMPVVCREIEEVKNQALSVYFIASGGAEPGFKEVYKQVEEPYILLTTPAYNSLAAAMEIMGFLQEQGLEGEILHGSHEEISKRLHILLRTANAKKKLNGMRLGCFGEPGGLIASNVEFQMFQSATGAIMEMSGGYELVAGHRRKRACELAGLEKMPVIIKDLTDDEATVIMVDSNIQREELLISEKAFAYKMKYEALKRQGKRSDLTSCQVGKKLAAEEVSQNTGDSSRQILRYIHLTELVAELLELADEKKLPFNTAVEVSYLRTEEQQILLQYMSNHNMVPSMKQAKELKQISKERMLTYSEIDQICMNENTEKVQVQIPAKKLKQYFPETYTKTQMEEIIFMLLASWAEREGKE